jgi:hypothetical protein
MSEKKPESEILAVLPDSELDLVTGGGRGSFVVGNANFNIANVNSNNVITNSAFFNIGG